MLLLKRKYINLLTYQKTFQSNGRNAYTLLTTVQMLVSVMRYKASFSPDFQIDLARLKDHWLLYSNEEILSDGSQIVQIGNLYYLPIYNEDNKYLDPRDGYFKTIVKLNVDQAYGVQNG